MQNDARQDAMPWFVYRLEDDAEVYEEVLSAAAKAKEATRTKEEAAAAEKKRGHDETIDEASDESFPASDPPAWTRITTR